MYGGGHGRDYQHSRQRSRERGYNGGRRQRERSNQRDDWRRGGRRDRSNSEERRNYRHHSSHRGDSMDQGPKFQHETYQQREIEETEQKLRLAIRNNSIQFDAKLLQMLRNLPSSKQDELTQQAQSLDKIHQCILVRELFISGLSEMNEAFIDSIMRQYGEIQKIQIIKNFAYVKFHKVEDASNACAEYHTINMRIHNMHNSNFKIFFADHVKRWNVVSNSINYENVEDLVPVIYASIRNDKPFNTEQYIREGFSKFGFIRNVQMKPSELPGPKVYKSYVLIEFETLAQALRARERVRQNRQRYLGDRKAEVTLLIDSEKITRQWPNVKNQLRYQIKRQNNTAKMMNPMSSGINNTINPFLQHSQQQQQQPHHQLSKPMMNLASVQDNSDIFDMIKQFAEKEVQSDWCGFFTRNKQFRVEVDFTLIHKEPFELEILLNVSHRADLNEGCSREDYVLAGKFRAANQLNVPAFNKYIEYFIKKNRAGIVQSEKYLIYLLPPIESLPLPYPIKSDELLALFFKR